LEACRAGRRSIHRSLPRTQPLRRPRRRPAAAARRAARAEPVGINPAALDNPTGLTGQGGIGKTQLAVAYGYRDEYPDGVYWLNAANDLRLSFTDGVEAELDFAGKV